MRRFPDGLPPELRRTAWARTYGPRALTCGTQGRFMTQSLPSGWLIPSPRRLRAAVILLVLAVAAAVVPAMADAATPSIKMTVPKGARVGHSVIVTLNAMRSGTIGAHEAVL